MKEPVEAINPYENCCGTLPVTFSLGKGKIYIPNAFTANGDGISDVFVPSYNEHIHKIKNLILTNVAEDSVLYSLASFNIEEPIANAWWGQISDTSFHKGLFKYKMTIFDDVGDSLLIQGEACSILCDSAALDLKNNKNCLYIIQADGKGSVDTSLPILEEYCYGK
jgi:hypothetical protein